MLYDFIYSFTMTQQIAIEYTIPSIIGEIRTQAVMVASISILKIPVLHGRNCNINPEYCKPYNNYS